MTGLPATGTLTYNGYTFDGASHIQVACDFVYDEADRSIVGHKYVIQVQATITDDGNSTDDSLENVRKRLGVAGAKMSFVSKGFGDDLRVGGGGDGPTGVINDIMSGPKPRVLQWTPIGNDLAAEVVWVVELTVKSCPPGIVGRNSGVMAMNYGVTYDIDENGASVRTISGYLQIAQKGGFNRIQDTADRYREKFAVPVIAGFKRSQRWEVSYDKSRVDFTITDTEVDSANAIPRGLTGITATHSYVFRRPMGGGRRQRINVISMEATVAAGLSGVQAWLVFVQLVKQRVAYARQRRANPFLTQLEIQESIFGRTHSFQIAYQLLRPVKNILGTTGLFQQVGTDWNQWSASLLGTTYRPRGRAGLGEVAQNDAVITLCTSTDYTAINNVRASEVVPPVVVPGGTNPPTMPTADRSELENSYPDEEASFLDYEMTVMPSAEDYSVAQPIIQEPASDSGFWPLDGASPPPTFSTDQPGNARQSSVIQRTGTTDWRVRIAGKGTRAGYQVPRPKLERVGDRVAHPVNQQFMQRVVDVAFGVPVYQAAWVLDYVLERPPGVVGTPGNITSEQPSANA